MTHHAITCCRSCQSDRLEAFLDLGLPCLSGFPLPDEKDPPRVPLKLVLCHNCLLVQLSSTTDADLLYRTFHYRSAVTQTMQKALAELAQSSSLEADLKPGDTVCDIGSNDSTMLRLFNPSLRRVGFEPARNLMEDARKPDEKGNPVEVINDYFSPGAFQRTIGGKAKLVTVVAMFYDLDDPGDFLDGVRQILDEEGTLVIQMAHLGAMFRTRDVGNICLPSGSLVVTSAGLHPIDEIVEGEEVLTHLGRFRKVLKTFAHDHDGELVTLRAYGFGHSLRVTPEHPVMVDRGCGWEWVSARDVRVGDVVGKPVISDSTEHRQINFTYEARRTSTARPSMRPIFKKIAVPINDDFMAVTGWYLAEGSAGPANVAFYFGLSSKEVELAEKCAATIRRLGFSARLVNSPTSTVVQASVILGRLLKTVCGHGASRKRVGRFLLAMPAERLRALFDAYMEGDGYRYRADCLRGSTVSGDLAFDMAAVANKLGYKCSICQSNTPPTRLLLGRTVAQRPLWDILVHTRPLKKMKCWVDGGYQCGRVRSVERAHYEGKVHNLEVDEDNTYVTPAMTVHNCHEHLTYFSMTSLMPLLNRHGFYPCKVEENSVNGGSFRVYCRTMPLPMENVIDFLVKESRAGVGTQEYYEDFARGVRGNRDEVLAALEKLPRPWYAYGASTKGNTMLQYWGMGECLKGAAERDPRKWGRVTAGTRIPIVSEEVVRREARTFLVPIWPFRNEIVAREQEWLRKGKMLFPLPEVDAVGGEL